MKVLELGMHNARRQTLYYNTVCFFSHLTFVVFLLMREDKHIIILFVFLIFVVFLWMQLRDFVTLSNTCIWLLGSIMLVTATLIYGLLRFNGTESLILMQYNGCIIIKMYNATSEFIFTSLQVNMASQWTHNFDCDWQRGVCNLNLFSQFPVVLLLTCSASTNYLLLAQIQKWWFLLLWNVSVQVWYELMFLLHNFQLLLFVIFWLLNHANNNESLNDKI